MKRLRNLNVRNHSAIGKSSSHKDTLGFYGQSRPRSGFTLAEVLVAMGIFVLVMGGAATVIVHVMRSDARLALEIGRLSEGHRVASTLRNNLRLTSLAEMILYPDDPPHMAVSYPIPGRIEDAESGLDASGFVRWGETIILHAYPIDEPQELRMTRFSPRDNEMSDSERREQLSQVALSGNGGEAINGENSTTRTLSRIGPYFSLQTDGRPYNFYAQAEMLDRRAHVGAAKLNAGENRILFRPTGRSDSSMGFGFIIDQLDISPSGIPIEAESLTISSQSGAIATVLERTASNWSDRKALSFPATSTNSELELLFWNDTWHETTFKGGHLEDAKTDRVSEFGQSEEVLVLRGRQLAWKADLIDYRHQETSERPELDGFPIRVLIRGGLDPIGQDIMHDGDGVTIVFEAATPDPDDEDPQDMHILRAYIAELEDHDVPGPNLASESVRWIEFGEPENPQEGTRIAPGGTARSVPLSIELDREKSYAITYYLAQDSGQPREWTVDRTDTYIIDNKEEWLTNFQSGFWSGNPDLKEKESIYGVAELRTTYADEGTHTSRIVDTQLTAPQPKDVDWSATLPVNTAVELQLRSGSQPDLSDAPEWETVPRQTAPGEVIFNSGRYVQARAILKRDPVHDETPRLRNFTYRWHGEPATVDFGGVFQRHPSGGIVEVLVNEQEPASAFRLEIDIGSKDEEGRNLPIVIEVTPRN